MLHAVARLLLALWTCAVAAVAFLVAPQVFGFLDDNARAGELMGPIFGRVDVFGVVAALVFAAAARRSRWRLALSLFLGALAAVNVLVLAPAIRARGAHLDLAHQASTVLWSVLLTGGVVLLIAGPAAGRRAPAARQ